MFTIDSITIRGKNMADKNHWTSRHHDDDHLWEKSDGAAATEHKNSDMTAAQAESPATHPDFNGYLDRIVEISQEAHDSVADNGQIIAQVLMDADYHAYKQAINRINKSDIRVIGVTATPSIS